MTSREDLALRLRRAYESGATPPLRDGLDPLDSDGAYAIQAINTRHWIASGRRPVGHKVGLTAKAVQMQLGVAQPDFGVLFGDMAISEGGELAFASLLQPKAEAEIAFIMGRAIDDPSISTQDVAAAVESVCAAIEIVDSRIADWKITFADTVADNGSSARFVLGADRHRLADVDLYTCGMVLEVDGNVASLGAGAACLGHPLNAVTWLARTLAEHGEGLREGDIVLSGALGPMVTLTPGTALTARIGGLGACSFTCGATS